MNERRTFSADLAAEVRRVAKLARIYVSEDDVAQWTRDLGRILEYVRQLNELNVRCGADGACDPGGQRAQV